MEIRAGGIAQAVVDPPGDRPELGGVGVLGEATLEAVESGGVAGFGGSGGVEVDLGEGGEDPVVAVGALGEGALEAGAGAGPVALGDRQAGEAEVSELVEGVLALGDPALGADGGEDAGVGGLVALLGVEGGEEDLAVERLGAGGAGRVVVGAGPEDAVRAEDLGVGLEEGALDDDEREEGGEGERRAAQMP